MSVLTVEGLTGGYTKASILRDVSIGVGAAEIVACFGRNGAGKTSLLRALCGALPVCTGTIALGDRRVDRLSTWTRAQLGMAHVPEGRQIFKAMTVRENLEVGALAAKSRASRRDGRSGPPALEEIFELFPRLGERQQQRAGTLSGGEQQMVAIGRALMSSPRIMLIDEMSAGLAPVLTDRLVDGLIRIRERGVAILLVEQAPHLVAEIIDRAYLLEQGRVVGDGTLEQLGGAEGIADLYLGVHAGTEPVHL
jgi:branched-chain amino acid transport system ATP-binding protein